MLNPLERLFYKELSGGVKLRGAVERERRQRSGE